MSDFVTSKVVAGFVDATNDPRLATGGGTNVTTTATQTLTNKTLTSAKIDDGDAGCTVTSADQTSASATVTIPDCGDAADEFVLKDTTQTLTNKTLSSGTVGAGVLHPQTKFCTTEFVAVTGTTGATLTDIVGLTGFSLAAAGVYLIDAYLMIASTTNCGIKLGLKLTTATLTSVGFATALEAASSVKNANFSTATDEASIVADKDAAWTAVRFKGRIVVNAAGTVALRAAQETAHADETKVLVGSSVTLTRIS